ncbi:uncharacterized protein LOC119987854 [Tripterygium wilfordii]|uniref:uncharacterized protein LOC119987854 n=1 Tax=Tripterygium wilfordii TaxID=458696 RepID=UPI0018F85A68|nr:uncharacterized protein LOC119987854 [Tripterygium wilfordii]
MKKDTGEFLWSSQKKAEQSLRKMTSTPFVWALRLEDLPNKFSPPTFAVYDGKTDPVAHISTYTHKMALWAGRDELMCKMFPSSLGTTAMKWFHQLPENSVSSWREVARIFVGRFIANSRDPATLDTLFALHLRRGESLRAYAARYLDTYADIEDCDERTAVATFCLGLPRDYKLRESLTMAPPKSMAALQDRIKQYIADKPYFRRPNKMSGDLSTRNQSKWCSYHKDKGHKIEDCREFKRHLEELVQQGHLKKFIDKEKTTVEKKAEPQLKEQGEPSHYVVNFIDAMVPNAQFGDEIRRKALATERPREAITITFTKEDATGVIFLHNDTLVISLQIGAATVKRMMVDQGSLAEIMYYSLFQKLGKTHADLIPAPTHMVGLNATLVWPLGRIRMPITAGPRTIEVDFLVIDLPSTCNAIMGRTWLHLMEVVPSSYH